MENKKGFFMTGVILFTLLFISQNWNIADAACSLPEDIVGAWEDSTKGVLTFNDTSIFNYEFANFGSLTLTCWQQNDTVYVFESSEFEFFSLNFTAYFCWNFTQVSSDMFYYYEYGDPLVGANNERVRVYLPSFSRVYDDICANMDVGLGTYRVLFRNNTLSSAISNCPTELQNYYNYSVVDTSGINTCSASNNQLDVCTNSSAFIFNGSECSTPLAYSDTGAVNCLFAIQDYGNEILYMTLYNDGTVDDTITHRTTCMIVSYATPSSLVGTQYPNQCPNDMTETSVTSPGAYVYLKKTGGCSSDSFPWWILGLIAGIIIGFIIFIACCYKKKLDEEEKKKRLLAEEEGDGRYDPNDLLSRGDRPPYASITIMGGRRKGKDGRFLDDDEDDGEPPKIKRPKSEGKHRRFDKRKRMWVIDKDGNVKKVWKDGGESPDGGVEDDQVDGQGSSGRKSARFKDPLAGDDLEFSKKHGRKELKSAKEIEEKGDRDMNSSKLKKKMKGMLSARKSARFRKSARSGKKSKSAVTRASAYTHDGNDTERSWGSSDGEYEEVTLDSDRTETLENKANEEKEKQEEAKSRKGKGGKEKGGGVSPEVVATLAVVSEINEKDKKGKKLRSALKKKGKGIEEKKVDSEKKEGDKTQDEGVEKSAKDERDAGVEQNGKQGKESVAVAAAVVAKEAKDSKGKGEKTKDTKTTQDRKAEEKKVMDKKKVPGKAVAIVTGKEKEKDKVGEEEPKDEDKEKTADKADEKSTAVEDKTPAETVKPVAKEDVKKTAKEIKAEQKKKEKEEKQRLKEEQLKEKEAKRKEKEELKKKAKEEKDTIGDRYIAAQIALEAEKEAKKAEQEEKLKDEKGDKEESEQGVKQESDKKGETTSDRPPSQDSKGGTDTPSSATTLSESMKPRREQSILLDLDRTKSDLGMDGPDKRPSTTGERTLGAVTELVETARSQVEGRGGEREADLEKEERGGGGESHRDTPRVAVQHPGLKPEAKMKGKEISGQGKKSEQVQRGGDQKIDQEKGGKTDIGKLPPKTAETKEEKKSSDKETDKKTDKKTDDKPKPKGIMKQSKDGRAGENEETREKTAVIRKISVSEAGSSSKTDDSFHEKDSPKTQDSTEDSESSEEEIVPLKKKPRAMGFTFPDENMATNTFKQTGEIINAKPVKTRKRRNNRVTVQNLPNRTNQAFGIAKKTSPKSKTAAGKDGVDATGKDGKVSGVSGTDARGKNKGDKALPPVKGPMTIKDISKKPGNQGDMVETPRGRSQLRKGRTADPQESSTSPAGPKRKAESLSPAAKRAGAGQGQQDRRISEVDNKQQMQLMTRLMSLAEQTEGEGTPTPRASTGRKSARSRHNQTPKLGELVGPRPGIVIEGMDQLDGSFGSTPDELKTAREGVIPSRPPTKHNYIRPSRENTMHMEPISPGFSRSSSERRHVSASGSRRGGTWETGHTPDSEEQRFVTFKQGVLQQLEKLGQEEMNAILYPRIQRYPEEGPNRSDASYKSMNALQRIHRKKHRQVAPISMELPPIKGAYGKMIDDYDDIDDPRMRGLLEELYKDKKYLDKTLERDTDDSDFIQSRAKHGRTYLLNRARFWSTQQPIVRPGTTQAGSRASTALPSSRVPTAMRANREPRSISHERPSKSNPNGKQ